MGHKLLRSTHSPIDVLPVADDVQVYDRPLYVVANSVVAYAVSPLSHRDPSEFAAPIRIGLKCGSVNDRGPARSPREESPPAQSQRPTSRPTQPESHRLQGRGRILSLRRR